MRSILIICITALVFCSLMTAVILADEINPIGENLFSNASFEVPSRDLRNLGVAQGWGRSAFEGRSADVKYELDNEVVFDGEASQKVVGNGGEEGVRTAVSRYLTNINPGEIYRFSVWVKHKGIVPGRFWTEVYKEGELEEMVPGTLDLLGHLVGTPSQVNVRIIWADSDHQGMDNYYDIPANAYMFADMEKDDWQKLEVVLKVPDDQPFSHRITTARIDLFLFRANGTVWWDAFEVERLE